MSDASKIKIVLEKCTGCTLCVRVCPFGAIKVENKKAVKEKELLKSEEIKLNGEKSKLEDEVKEIKAKAEGLKIKRNELAVKVDKNVLSKYERLITGRDGLAIVPIRQGACQGCFRILPPQVMNEVKMNIDIIFCEYCSRILYAEE